MKPLQLHHPDDADARFERELSRIRERAIATAAALRRHGFTRRADEIEVFRARLIDTMRSAQAHARAR